MAGKQQFMGLVDSETLHRLDALRIVTGRSRARVAEAAMVGGGLRQLEKENKERLDRLQVLADRANMTMVEYVEWYARQNSKATYGPKLEALEAAAGIEAEVAHA